MHPSDWWMISDWFDLQAHKTLSDHLIENGERANKFLFVCEALAGCRDAILTTRMCGGTPSTHLVLMLAVRQTHILSWPSFWMPAQRGGNTKHFFLKKANCKFRATIGQRFYLWRKKVLPLTHGCYPACLLWIPWFPRLKTHSKAVFKSI